MATTTLTLLFILLYTSYVFSQRTQAKGCHGNRYRLSCLINMCRFSKCAADPDAKCRKVKTPCHGCKAVWYHQNGRIADCRPKKHACPDGVQVRRCPLNSCRIPCYIRDFKRAACRQNHCGTCRAEYYVGGRWLFCPTHRVRQRPALLPFDASVLSRSSDGQIACAPDEPRVQCTESVCILSRCPNYPGATCVPNGCGTCRAEWFMGTTQVDCESKCPPNVLDVSCVVDPCKYSHCPNHEGAECRVSTCGSCHAKFYKNGLELKDCGPAGKVCPPGIQRYRCSWTPCPSPVCYSNKRLMCRTNPCGGCRYEYVDVFNGEVVYCEVPSPFSHRPPKDQIQSLSALDLGGPRTSAAVRESAKPVVKETVPQPRATVEEVPAFQNTVSSKGIKTPASVHDTQPIPVGQTLPDEHALKAGKIESTKAQAEGSKIVQDNSVPEKVQQQVLPPTDKVSLPISSADAVDQFSPDIPATADSQVLGKPDITKEVKQTLPAVSSLDTKPDQMSSASGTSVHMEFDPALSERALLKIIGDTLGQTPNKDSNTRQKNITKDKVLKHEIPKTEFQISDSKDKTQGIPINLNLLMNGRSIQTP